MTRLTPSPDNKTLTVTIPFKVRGHRSGKQIVTPDGSLWAPPPRIDSALVKAIVRAHRWREMLESGRHGRGACLPVCPIVKGGGQDSRRQELSEECPTASFFCLPATGQGIRDWLADVMIV